MFHLKASEYPNEKPSIPWDGEWYCSSQFGKEEFLGACEGIAGITGDKLLGVCNAYVDVVNFTKGNRRTGEPNYNHPVGVALLGILEFGETDYRKIINALIHDLDEDTDVFKPSFSLLAESEQMTSEQIISYRYRSRLIGAVNAAVTKVEKKGDKKNYEQGTNLRERHLFFNYKRIARAAKMEVRKVASEVKCWDRLSNMRTLPDNENAIVKCLVETARYIYPIAEIAGPQYLDALKREFDKHSSLLTDAHRKEIAMKVDYSLSTLSANIY